MKKTPSQNQPQINDILERLSGGAGSLQQNDYDDWNQMVGSAPKDKFGRAVYDSIRQVDPDEYVEHVTPGLGGTDPLGSLTSGQRGGLLETIFGELTRRGIQPQEVARDAGIGSLDPRNVSPDDLAGLLGTLQRENPKVYGRVAAEYQDQPDILQSLLGNKALMGLITGIGGKLIMDQMTKRR